MFTTDTRKPHCPIRIVYAGPGVGPYHTNELTDRIYLPRDKPLAIIKYTEHSDYSGSDVEASNYRVLCEARDIDHLVQIYGSHGYKALAYDATLGPVPSCEQLCEILESLEAYPLVDEDDHSELEGDLEMEAWESHGLSDFRRALEPLLDALDPGHEHELPDDDAAAPNGLAKDTTAYLRTCSVAGTWETLLWDLWRLGCEQLNINGDTGFVIETGCTVHFYIDDWFAKAGADKRYPADKPIHKLLYHMAKACRVEAGRP